jgi:hypothetical protein
MAKQTRKRSSSKKISRSSPLNFDEHQEQETDIQSAIMLRLGRRSDVRLWRSNVVNAIFQNKDGSTRSVKAGTKGQGDLSGLVDVGGEIGVHLEVEVKRPGEDQRPDQRMRQDIITRFGGIYIVAHSADEAERELLSSIEHKRRFLIWAAEGEREAD